MLEIPIGVAEFLDTPMDRWRAFVEQMQPQHMRALAADLAALAETAARGAAYVDSRELGFSHAAAVVNQNDAAAKLRRALGLTVRRRDITF